MTFPDDPTQRLRAGLVALGLDSVRTDRVCAPLMAYACRLEAANRSTNLTRVGSLTAIVDRHLLDATAGYLYAEKQGLVAGHVIDVGSGQGTPGLIWAILGGFDRVVCCEATGKKAAFIRDAADALGLNALEVAAARSESLGRDPAHRDAYDLAVARALAPLNVLIELTAPFIKTGGAAIYFKGRAVDEELAASQRAGDELGLAFQRPLRYALPCDDGGGVFLLGQKCGPTPDRYPRRPGMAAKRPL